MTEGLRSKNIPVPVKADEKLESVSATISKLLTPALDGQRTFIEKQFAKFETRLDSIRAEVSKNSSDIKSLKTDQKGLSKHVTKLEDNLQSTCSKLEASIAELEDRSRRDNVRIINLPENVENGDINAYVVSSLPKWFPDLAGGKLEVMRAHQVGPERTTSGGPRTVICKMLRFTDRDLILRAARKARTEVNGREVRFTADYSNYTAKRRRAFAPVMESARKLGYTPFLIYPAKIKLSRGAEVHIYSTHGEVEDFLGAQTQGPEVGD